MSAAKLTYVGHATVLIELAGVRILTDPFLRKRVLHIRRQAATPADEVRRDLDAALLSHLHPDHFDQASLRRLGRGVSVVVPHGARSALARRGFRNVTELDRGESLAFGEVTVRATAAAHDGRRIPVGPAIDAAGYVIQGAGLRLFFAGDTAAPEGLENLAGNLDVAMLPIAGWGLKLPPADHLGPETAAEATAALAPRIVVPIHWGTLLRVGLGKHSDELLDAPVREFAEAIARLAPDVELRVLDPGQSTVIEPG
jgi:L-ascorbate metabolism protein UlaG (beta-lactamase superfamily)